ncbi:MAG: cell division protein FtsA [Saprospiraceae bacterium]|nr:cell division protein FtsA [Saprospiraceae bacterium]
MNAKDFKKMNIVAALDIGTTKVCCIVGRKDEYGKIDVIGTSKVESEGVLRGVIANIDKTVKAISDAVDLAEKDAQCEIQEVFVGIAGQHIKSLQHRGILARDNSETEISKDDIDRLVQDMYKLGLTPGDKILHVIPQEFTVDNEQGIVDPIGMSGHRLEANFHIITGQIAATNNIMRCVERANLKVADMTLEPIASAEAVLSKEEKEAGVALVDIGGGTTDITIFQDGIIRHTAVIAFGGNVITKDIKEGCTVMTEQAEKLKVKFGSALADEIVDNRIITIPGLKGRDPKEISEKNLSRIIQARLEEILDLVMYEIRRSGYEKKMIGGIVLTGGGALLKNFELLCEYHTGLQTRIGYPNEHFGYGFKDNISSPIYATGVGLLMYGLKMKENQQKMLLNSRKEKITAAMEKVSQAELGLESTPVTKSVPPAAVNTESLKKPLVTYIKRFFEPTPDPDLR